MILSGPHLKDSPALLKVKKTGDIYTLLLMNGENIFIFYSCYGCMGLLTTIIVFKIVHDPVHDALFDKPALKKRARDSWAVHPLKVTNDFATDSSISQYYSQNNQAYFRYSKSTATALQ